MARPTPKSEDVKSSSAIISFRLPGEYTGRLQTKYKQPANNVVGITSEEQLLRKVAMDWIDGKLIYVSAEAQKANPLLEAV